MITPVELTQRLIAFDTVNPPGNETPCARSIGQLLEAAGFQTRYVPLDQNRDNLIATIGGAGDKLPICFSGHTDVVPLGEAPWSVPPFGALLKDGKIYGRGSSDMKSGVAAFVVAALELAPYLEGTAGVAMVITASEEDGCRGSRHLARHSVLPNVGAIIIGEPTGNEVLAGHKGVFRLEARAHGVTAHGSMPQKGVNAIYKGARAVLALEALDLSAEAHPVLGCPTLNVGWFRGGLNVNSVPDLACFGLDVRIVPGNETAKLTQKFVDATGGEVEFASQSEFAPVWSDPGHHWIKDVADIVRQVTGETKPILGAPFFTDAGALKPAMGGPPTLILGPGDPEQAHQTDEYCRIDRLEQATEIYKTLMRRWCGL